jgi:amidophosphoribosyltransferase
MTAIDKSDKFHDECGVMAVHGHPEASKLAYLGLYALQHRGQESAGIASSDFARLHNIKAMGLVADIFTEDVLARAHPLLNHRRLGVAECATHSCRVQ